MTKRAASLLERLSAAGVAPCDGDYNVAFQLAAQPDGAGAAGGRGKAALASPLVSCLMVSRGDPAVAGFAVRCFARQTWANRELVVVAPPPSLGPMDALLRASGIARYVLTSAPPGLSLGELRNLAIARASGDILVQWDDDDLCDPLRLALSVMVLRRTGAAAAFMARWLLWWPARRLAAITQRRLWEGSIAVWRAQAPVYPALERGEDTEVRDHLAYTRRVAAFDAPLQYVYAVTGRNTWSAVHFETELAQAELVLSGDDYDALNRLLAPRLPVLEYQATLLARAEAEG